MYNVYVLKGLKSSHYYTGCTSNLTRRLEDHNNGKCKWTKTYGPWKLHYSEHLNNKSEAFAREKYLKTHAGRIWLKNNLLGP